MPAGADKGFTFDPPGAIGLVFDDARVLLKLHDPDVTVPPKDEAGALDDLLAPSIATVPTVVGAAMGQGGRSGPRWRPASRPRISAPAARWSRATAR